jgi:AraC family transcriptional regulator, melibiose operon regulatory protein
VAEVYNEVNTGLLGWFGQPWEIKQLHRHNDIELNLVVDGELHYLLAGEMHLLCPNQLLVFWAVMPHRIVHCQASTKLAVIHLPLLEFLRWNLPKSLIDGLLHTRPIVQPSPDPTFDRALFGRWAADLQQTPTPAVNPAPLEQHQIVLLELEARLRRLANNLDNRQDHITPTPKHLSPVAWLAGQLAQRHAQDINLQHLAGELGLHPNYMAGLFQKTLGLTMHQYLVQQRIAHAQRLLVTSHLPILEVASEVGFGSLSRFYQAFVKLTGFTPKRYRNTHARALPITE